MFTVNTEPNGKSVNTSVQLTWVLTDGSRRSYFLLATVLFERTIVNINTAPIIAES